MELRFNNLNQIIIEMEHLDEVAHLISDDEYLSASNALMRQYVYLSEVLRSESENSDYINFI
jgi:hypothetical protein